MFLYLIAQQVYPPYGDMGSGDSKSGINSCTTFTPLTESSHNVNKGSNCFNITSNIGFLLSAANQEYEYQLCRMVEEKREDGTVTSKEQCESKRYSSHFGLFFKTNARLFINVTTETAPTMKVFQFTTVPETVNNYGTENYKTDRLYYTTKDQEFTLKHYTSDNQKLTIDHHLLVLPESNTINATGYKFTGFVVGEDTAKKNEEIKSAETKLEFGILSPGNESIPISVTAQNNFPKKFGAIKSTPFVRQNIGSNEPMLSGLVTGIMPYLDLIEKYGKIGAPALLAVLLVGAIINIIFTVIERVKYKKAKE